MRDARSILGRAVGRLARALPRPQAADDRAVADELEAIRAELDDVAAVGTRYELLADRLEDRLPREEGFRLARELRALDDRLREMESSLERLSDLPAHAPTPSGQIGVAPTRFRRAAPELSPEFLAALIERFRGEPEAIAERLRPYLDELREVRGLGPVVDLGCGRGELLALLREAGIDGYGVEANPLFVNAAADAQLDVRQGDALAHLRGLKHASAGAVTAIHLVEHLAPGDVLELLREAHRVVCPSGLLLLETPNPENPLVGAGAFWLDPTHVRPLPPDYLAFAVENAGFGDVAVRRMRRFPLPIEGADQSEPPLRRVVEVLNATLGAGEDYAVVARRPHA